MPPFFWVFFLGVFMPLPLLGVAAIGAWGTGVMTAASLLLPDSVKRIAKEEFVRLMVGDLQDLEDAAISGAFERLGLEIDPSDGGLSAQAITRAINEGPLAGSDVQLTNVFDKSALKTDLMRVAMAQAAQAYGLEVSGLSVESIKQELRRQVSREVMEQVRASGGDLAPEAKDLAALVQQIEAYKRAKAAGEDVPLDMSPKGISNRERQARYRATHKRVWVEA